MKFTLATLFALPTAALAAAVDVSAIVDGIDEQGLSIAAVGAACLLLCVAHMAYKWVRKAL